MNEEPLTYNGGSPLVLGAVVKVRARGRGFGRGCIGRVTSTCRPNFGMCELEIITPGRPNLAGWKQGNKVSIGHGLVEVILPT